jgi:hypothetical protein
VTSCLERLVTGLVKLIDGCAAEAADPADDRCELPLEVRARRAVGEQEASARAGHEPLRLGGGHLSRKQPRDLDLALLLGGEDRQRHADPQEGMHSLVSESVPAGGVDRERSRRPGSYGDGDQRLRPHPVGQ